MKVPYYVGAALGLSLSMSTPAWAAMPCEQQALKSIHFSSNENLFVMLAWLNWVGERDEPLTLTDYDDMQADLLTRLQNAVALKPLYARHRAAYDQYLKESPPYVRNGLLLIDSTYYGSAPHFPLADLSKHPDLSPYEKARIAALPSSALLHEFYTAFKLHDLWQNVYKPKHDAYLQQYKANALKGVQRAQCFLNMQPTGPVDISINPLDSFGTTGQTSYNPQTGRYLIKIHIDKKYAQPKMVEDTSTHEYTHVLMNDALKPYAREFQDKFQQIADATQQQGLASLPVQEVFARSVGYLHWSSLYPDYVDSMVVNSTNPLYLYLVQQVPAYSSSGLSFKAYLPQFLKNYEPRAAVQAWQQAEQRVEERKSPTSEQALQQIKRQGFDALALRKAVNQYKPMFTPKLKALEQKTGTPASSSDPWQLVQQAFEQAEYFDSHIIIRENVYMVFKNPLYLQLSELLKENPSRNADAFVKTLFTQFDPATEAKRWKQIQQRFAEEDKAKAQGQP